MSASPTAIAPIFLVRDMEANISFWSKNLGFAVDRFGEPTNYAIVYRGQARIMLALTDGSKELVPNWKIETKTSNAFIWVDDVKSMYQEAVERGAPIDWSLYKAPWGGLEFGTQDPEGRDIAFGQNLSEELI